MNSIIFKWIFFIGLDTFYTWILNVIVQCTWYISCVCLQRFCKTSNHSSLCSLLFNLFCKQLFYNKSCLSLFVWNCKYSNVFYVYGLSSQLDRNYNLCLNSSRYCWGKLSHFRIRALFSIKIGILYRFLNCNQLLHLEMAFLYDLLLFEYTYCQFACSYGMHYDSKNTQC